MLTYDEAVDVIVSTLVEILAKPFSESNGEDFSSTGAILSEFLGRVYSVDSTDVTTAVIMRLNAKAEKENKTCCCTSCDAELPEGAKYCPKCGNKQ